MSGIVEKYNSLRAQGFIPAEIAPGVELPVVEVPTGDGQGTFFAYAFVVGGISTPISIYFSPRTGVFEVHGAILSSYLAQGGPLGILGYPISDEYDDVVGSVVVGRVSDFEGGSLFWNAATGSITIMTTGPITSDFEIIEGIDVSYAQGNINWNQVITSNIAFAYIKATEADNLKDNQFAANWSNSRGRLPRGAYHYFHPRKQIDLTRPQADSFIAALEATGDLGELPPMVDIESLDSGISADEAIASLQFFLSLVEQGFGKRPIIYTYPSFWKTAMNNTNTFANRYHLWIANYGAARADGGYEARTQPPILPGLWRNFGIWQYAVKPGVPGIATLVDRNQVFLPAGTDLATFLSSIPNG